ncbi:ROK family protein [Sphingobacterium bambusae]|uniref:ROK family protein n=1 Tax=Sphingobacterium bambusae TaxID=662858 RepID=A0ABW6BHD8_9SPHI|nr:ROK family protein [Sphingobacterium bambusae]WPL50446.1 ROK family protein [Sphingobacterium bambusae]
MNLTNELIRQLYYSDGLSVAELSAYTGKSIPKVTSELNKLLAKQLLVEDGFAASTGGRRAMRYSLCENHLPSIVAIAIDQFYTSIAILDAKNIELVPTKKINTDIYHDKEAFARIIAKTKEQLSHLPEEKKQYCIVGVTMPGFVDSEKGINQSFPSSSPFHKIKENVQRSLGYPTSVANDSSAIAIAEHKFGNGQGCADLLVINFNWGVGLGMIIGNNLYRGHSGYAGEFSHIPLANSQKLCSCGKKGCLEVEASLVSMLETINHALVEGQASCLQALVAAKGELVLEDVISAFGQGDQVALVAVKHIMHMLGKGLSTLIHIMNPERIIVSGKAVGFGDGLLPALFSSIQEYCIPRLSRLTDISVSKLPHTQIIASACIAMQQTIHVHPKLIHNNIQQL